MAGRADLAVEAAAGEVRTMTRPEGLMWTVVYSLEAEETDGWSAARTGKSAHICHRAFETR